MAYEITVKTGLLWRYDIICTTENTSAQKSADRGNFWQKPCQLQIMPDNGPTGETMSKTVLQTVYKALQGIY